METCGALLNLVGSECSDVLSVVPEAAGSSWFLTVKPKKSNIISMFFHPIKFCINVLV